jgi:hypothetical protein
MMPVAASVMRIMSAATPMPTPMTASSKAAPGTVVMLIGSVYEIMVSAMKRGVTTMMVMTIKAPVIRVVVKPPIIRIIAKTPIIGIVIIAM